MSYEVHPVVASPDQPQECADSMHAIASCCTLFPDYPFFAPIVVVGLGTQPPEVPGYGICAEIAVMCFVVGALRSTIVT